MNKQTVVSAGHPSADIVVRPTRDKDANLGVGRAYRQDANMLPYKAMRIKRSGMTTPQWRQSAAVEINKGVLPKSRAMDVVIRSGNTDPGAIGIQGYNWGIAGVGDAPKVPAPMSGTVKLAAVAGLAFLVYRLTR
jgi:hypothetical protein